MKSDRSIRNICIAAIRRSTIKPIEFPSTALFDNEFIPILPYDLAIFDGELPIAHTLIDRENWTLVTTRRIVSSSQGKIQEASAKKVKSWNWGDFKGHNKELISRGELKIDNGDILKIHIESGRASMVIIKGITALVRQVRK